MLPSPIRLDLRSVPDFFATAKRKSVRGFGLWWTPQLATSADSPALSPGSLMKLAIIVSKKHGGAVQRVKIKRMWRARLIELWQQYPALFERPQNVVVVPFGPRVPELNELEQSFRSVLGSTK